MNIALLSGGAALHRNEQTVNYFVLIPYTLYPYVEYDEQQLVYELMDKGLELIPPDECEPEYTDDGLVIYVACIDGVVREEEPASLVEYILDSMTA